MFTKNEIKQRIAQQQAQGIDFPPYNLMSFIVNAALITQRDKSGVDYNFHTTRVSMSSTRSLSKHIIKKGHDLVEDSDWTYQDLRDVGFNERIINGIDGMTHRAKGDILPDGSVCTHDELYFDSIVRAGRNPDSLDGKLDDLTDNLSGARNNWVPTTRDLERQQKYVLSYNYLADIKKENIQPGTPFNAWMNAQDPKLQDAALLQKYSLNKPLRKEGPSI